MTNQTKTPPRFASPEGRFSVDYRSHDGIVILGQGNWKFRTMWTSAGNGLIHVYRDHVASVAVAQHARAIVDVSAELFSAADFTSRSRTPREHEIVLLQNRHGYAAAVEITNVRETPESAPGTNLTANYRILTDKTRDFSAELPAAKITLLRATETTLSTLRELEPRAADDADVIGLGHNQPPKEAALDFAEFSELMETLQELHGRARKGLTEEFLEKARAKLLSVSSRINAWAVDRIKLVEEGFYRKLGAAAATALITIAFGLWVVLMGKIAVVIDAIAEVGRALFGLGW